MENVSKNAELFDTAQFSGDTWIIASNAAKSLVERLQNRFSSLSKFINGEAKRGVLTGLTEAFIIDEQKRNQLINADPKSAEIIRPMVRGRDVASYQNCGGDAWLINVHNGIRAIGVPPICIEHYPAIKMHLDNYLEKLKTRTDQGDTPYNLRNCAYLEDFAKPKIMYQKFQVKPCFVYDETGAYCNDSMWIIPTENKGLLALLNSKMGWWLISKFCTQIQNGYQLIWKYFGNIPIAEPTADLSALAERMMTLTAELQKRREQFFSRLGDNFSGVKISRVLDDFANLPFGAFLKEMAKQKHPIPLKLQDEWREYFCAAQTACRPLQTELSATDKEIDKLVYVLYGLTPAEIAVVEG
ncbi:MAG: TaqI-like C-terminal specificity domain-containing protein [Thermoguttaceae bacterium]